VRKKIESAVVELQTIGGYPRRGARTLCKVNFVKTVSVRRLRGPALARDRRTVVSAEGAERVPALEEPAGASS
jgi:hypothetical protein